MSAHRAGGEEDSRRGPRAGHQSRDGLPREVVVDDGLSGTIDRDAIPGGDPVARQQQDHLQAGERPQHRAVSRTEAGQRFGGGKREIHARLEDEPLLRAAIDEEALGMPDVVGDGTRVLGHENQRGVAGETLTETAGHGQRGPE